MIKHYIKQEQGRSMVEMLGVLAIIGVLSVGGISGYTTAMNKHKANEILNAAAVRAMEVSAQIQSGVDPSTATGTITSGEMVGAATLSKASTVNADQFKLEFSTPVDTAVCNQMKNIAGDNSAVGVACDRLLYNNDMSTGVENKNVDSVDADGNYTCKTEGFDPDSKCESCKTGYSGLSCNTCAEGYESDGNGGCQEVSTGPIYHIIRSGKTHAGAKTACEGYKGVSGTETGWHLASAIDPNDGLNFSFYSSVGAILEDLTYDDDHAWNEGTYLWLAECYDGSKTNKVADSCPSNDSGTAWFVSSFGDIINDQRDGNGGLTSYPALCVR